MRPLTGFANMEKKRDIDVRKKGLKTLVLEFYYTGKEAKRDTCVTYITLYSISITYICQRKKFKRRR
jgi:hypothetical protein